MNGMLHAAFQASKRTQTHQTYHKNNWHSSPSDTIDLFKKMDQHLSDYFIIFSMEKHSAQKNRWVKIG